MFNGQRFRDEIFSLDIGETLGQMAVPGSAAKE
jgi:hypothetical protein